MASTTTRENLKDSRNEQMKLRHEIAQELLGRLHRNLPIIVDQALGELDVGLRSVHLRRIAEGENAS